MPVDTPPISARAAVIGGGPAGLMAAEALLAHGIAADVFDSMPSLGRKFLMAGKSGLNLTHAEAFEDFLGRFGNAAERLGPMLSAFPPDAIRDWARGLGVETFVGTSGRVFPQDFKAAPLLRAWLRRLRAGGVRIHVRHRWSGWRQDGALVFATPSGGVAVRADACVLALGGASWPRLGSDAAWVPWLAARGVSAAAFQPSNCGFDADWSTHFAERFEGCPVKGVTLTFQGGTAHGDVMVTRTGVEGGPVYALSSALREAIAGGGPARLVVDLLPDRTRDDLAARLGRSRGKMSMSNHLRKTVGLEGVKAGLLRECAGAALFADPDAIAGVIKALPLPLHRARPIGEAISCAGGIRWADVGAELDLVRLPGIFAAGEMLDWDAPTGGYLLSACLATGRWAGAAAAQHLRAPERAQIRS